MSDLLRMTYADIKTVKTRGVCQVVLEMPIEGMPDAFALLGAPVPGNEVWVAVARLKDGAAAAQEPEALPVPRKGTLAQQAGILCNERPFQKWAIEMWGHGVSNLADNAADFIRGRCLVASRVNLDEDAMAGERFRELRSDYKLWLNGIEAAA